MEFLRIEGEPFALERRNKPKMNQCDCVVDRGKPKGRCAVTANRPHTPGRHGYVLCIKNGKKLRQGDLFDLKRMQTFPSDFKLSDSKTRARRELGEAVPPKLAIFLAKELKKSLE